MSLAACGGQENKSNNFPEQNSTVSSSINYTVNGDSNILIAYFTRAENTHVENPDAVDVDATTSASVLLPGNAAKMAGWIQERTIRLPLQDTAISIVLSPFVLLSSIL